MPTLQMPHSWPLMTKDTNAAITICTYRHIQSVNRLRLRLRLSGVFVFLSLFVRYVWSYCFTDVLSHNNGRKAFVNLNFAFNLINLMTNPNLE